MEGAGINHVHWLKNEHPGNTQWWNMQEHRSEALVLEHMLLP